MTGLIAFARLRAEMLFEFVRLAVPLFRVSRLLTFHGDVWPFQCVFRVDLKPLFETWLRICLNCLSRAFRLTYATVDAFIWVDDEHVLAFIETVDRADLDAVHIFAPNAIVGHQIGHILLRIPQGECGQCVWSGLPGPSSRYQVG